MNNLAVILAGGSGSRFGADLPKQFLKIGDKTILELSIHAFQINPDIDQICVVVHPDHIAEVEKIRDNARFSKLLHIVPGGSDRLHSSLAAINHLSDFPEDSLILIHDAARPLVSQRIISDCIRALSSHPAVAVGLPATDTIWEVNGNHNIVAIPSRSSLFRAQTPQGASLGILRKAFLRADADSSYLPTDDAGVILLYLPDTPVFVVQGDNRNIKITFPEDLAFAGSMIDSLSLQESPNP